MKSLLIILWVSSSCLVLGQAQVDTKEAARKAKELIADRNLNNSENQSILHNKSSEKEQALRLEHFKNTTQYEAQFLIKKLEYERDSMDHRMATLWWQYFSSIIIFFIVIAIILSGLILTYIQFKQVNQSSPNTNPPQPSTAGQNPVNPTPDIHSLAIRADGFEIRSKVIGLIILALSLAFFYLYLVNVYPISEIK